MPITPEKQIIIPTGVEINNGPSEDSDSIVLNKPFKALVVGEEAEGAIPVRLVGEDGKPEDQVRYFHQRPRTSAKA